MELDQLRALVTVVEVGTFEAAATALHVSPSAVSQRIKALETGLGVVLLQRSKPVQPTPQGEVLLRSARQLTHLADDALAQLRAGSGGEHGGTAARVRVPIVVNADSIATWFADALVGIGRAGLVELEVRRDDEHVTADLLRSGEVMAAVTAEPAPVQGCAVRRLGTMAYRAKASRSFARRWFPEGVVPARLAVAPVVHFDRLDRMQSGLLARLGVGEQPPQTFVPDSTQFVAAIRSGLGWGMVPDLQDPNEVLVILDASWTTPVDLYWQAWKLSSPTLDHVTTAVTRAAARHLGATT